jgi:chaperonin GroES
MADIQPIEQSPFLENLAKNYTEETLKEIGNTVVEDYNTDISSRAVWDERIKKWYCLFSGLVDKKNFPWEDSSNVNIPILSTACLQFQARVYDAIMAAKEVAKCFSTDGQSVDAAKRCQKFMNWQLTEQMEEWEEDMDVLFLILPIYGVGVKKTYYDPILERNVSRTLRVDEFVAPYGVKRLEDAPRMTHFYEMHRNDVKIKGQSIWINTDKIDTEPETNQNDAATDHRDKTDESSGTTDTLESKDRPRIILEQHRTWDLDGDGIEEPYIITVDKETRQVLRIEDLTYFDPVAGVVKRSEYFTAYNFIPNPDSWMGFGFGHLLEHLSESVNSLTNQLIDSGTLSNTISGFVNRRSGLKTGDLEFSMGEFKGVDLPTDDVNKALYTFKFNPPSQVLFSLLNMLQGYSKELSSVSDAMLGKLPPSDTTATSMLAVMEQGLKVFSTIHKRVYRTFKKELKKIAALNAIYLEENIYFTVQDSTSEEAQVQFSGRDDFQQTIDVIPVADPTITSRAERLIRARQAYELGMGNPLVANDPVALYELTKNLFEAIEVKNIDEILKKPEPITPPDLRPEEEEAEFLAERDVKPLPQQDHQQHLQSHAAFKETEWADQLTPQGKKLLEGHIRETLSLLYLQAQEAIQNEAIAGGLTGVGGEPVFEGGIGGAEIEDTGFNF